MPQRPNSLPWPVFFSELIGTALLIGLGVSAVIMDFGTGSPVRDFLGEPGLRRAVTGFLFGSVGALIAVGPVGRISGAHINPVVTLAFVVKGRLGLRHAAAYVAAQIIGGAVGALPLLVWGSIGRSVNFGATLPDASLSPWAAVGGEVITSWALVTGLFVFIGHRRLRAFTPLLFPFLYAVMVYAEAPLSGTSTNPARSLGPSLVSGDWTGWWVYWIGPAAGALLAVASQQVGWLRTLEIEVAKLYHFEVDKHGVFGAKSHRAR